MFALGFVPGLAAILFMFGLAGGGPSLSTGFAALVFAALATGLIAGLFRLAHTWDEERT
jgi:hypothetical protein